MTGYELHYGDCVSQSLGADSSNPTSRGNITPLLTIVFCSLGIVGLVGIVFAAGLGRRRIHPHINLEEDLYSTLDGRNSGEPEAPELPSTETLKRAEVAAAEEGDSPIRLELN